VGKMKFHQFAPHPGKRFLAILETSTIASPEKNPSDAYDVSRQWLATSGL